MNIKNFFEVLEKRENATERTIVLPKDFSLAVETNESGREIINAVAETETFPIGETAWVSIRNKIGIKGDGLDRLMTSNPSLFCDVVNTLLQQKKKKFKLIRIENSLAAVLDEDYRVMPIAEIFPAIQQIMESEISDLEFITGESEITNSNMYFKTEKSKKTLIKKYNKQSEDYTPVIRVTSSDIGEASLSFYPGFLRKGYLEFLNNEGIRYVHKGEDKENLENLVRNAIPTLFEKLNENFSNFERLDNIVVKNVPLILEGLKDEFKLFSAQDKNALENRWLSFVNDATCEALVTTGETPVFSAYDLICLIQEYMADFPAEQIQKKKGWEHIISRLYASDFSKYDEKR